MYSLTKTWIACLLTIFCFYITPAAAQPYPQKKLSFEALTIDDGLSQGMVNCIIQDHFGFMWFATKEGLNRYDGYHFVVYRHDINDTTTLADNFIRCVFEDKEGRLWVGTAGHGLDLFDRTTETFIHFTHNDKDSTSLPSDNIGRIGQREDGLLLISTSNGVCVLNEKKGTAKQPILSFITVLKQEGYTICPADDKVWISTDKKLFCLTGNGVSNFHIDTVPIRQILPSADYKPQMQSIVHDSGKHILYFITNNTIVAYNEKTKQYNNSGKEISTWYVTQAALCSGDNIWIPEDTKLLLFNAKKEMTEWIQSADPRYDLLINSVYCLYEDRSGNIWVGTSGYGLLKYNAHADKFHHTDNGSIGSMQADNKGNVLVIKKGDVACIFDKKTQSYTGQLPDSSCGIRLYNSGMEAVLQDEDGTYWLARQSLLHYNAESNHVDSLPMNKRFCFPLYNDTTGLLWMGTDVAFASYNKSTKKFTYYPYPVNTDNTPYKFLEAIYKENDSLFWLGTTNGLYRFNSNTGSWTAFRNNPSNPSSLSYNLIFSLCPDPRYPDKYLWVGTNGGGLNRFEFSTGICVRYSVKDGLPNDVVYGILGDNDGNLWMSTNKGLSCFTLPKVGAAKGSFRNYEMKDGLQSNEFNRYSYCKTKDGTLFFGGVDGFNYFNPRSLSNNVTVPNIIITDFRIGNQPVTLHSREGFLQKPVYLTDKIELQYKYNMISFEFAAMDFSQPEKNLYQYKLEGFDENWIPYGTTHTATYTNLDPGTYTFRVKGSNSDGVWNEKGTSVTLVILPPWYMTWWFRLMIVMIVLSVLYAVYRYRLQQALKLQAIRNKIASDLHDEIGSNLSTISIFSDVAIEQAEGQPVSSLLNKISSYTQQSMEAMSDIVWMINAGNDRFENLVVRMRELAAELVEAKRSSLHLQIDEPVNTVKLDMEKRKNFWLIYKEALNNTAKYADAKNIWIELSAANGNVMLLVKDDGKGFDMLTSSQGNGLTNMKQRAEALQGKFYIHSTSGGGTVVKLVFKYH